jgi:hypothetical protein
MMASLLVAAEISRDRKSDRLAERLTKTALALDVGTKSLVFDVRDWVQRSGYSAGVWAERTEQRINPNGKASISWSKLLLPLLDRRVKSDALALRRYPEYLPEDWWQHLASNSAAAPDDDAGWWRDSLATNILRLPEAEKSACVAIRKAAAALNPSREPTNRESGTPVMNAFAWIQFTDEECDAFDPRRSEWTALEIVRSIVSKVTQIGVSRDSLRYIHPANVFIPERWRSHYNNSMPSWEDWRNLVRDHPAFLAREPSDMEDYRYVSSEEADIDNWRRQLVGVGRLLLGLLSGQFDGPRIWNIRGNERAYPLARGAAYEALAISSNTLLLLESCLSARSAENWQLLERPGLFGQQQAVDANDLEYDAPILRDPQDVLGAIDRAKSILEGNQIAVSRNQPRQLIPFRLIDFSKGGSNQEQDQADVV